jgi:hypothetical protein
MIIYILKRTITNSLKKNIKALEFLRVSKNWILFLVFVSQALTSFTDNDREALLVECFENG